MVYKWYINSPTYLWTLRGIFVGLVGFVTISRIEFGAIPVPPILWSGTATLRHIHFWFPSNKSFLVVVIIAVVGRWFVKMRSWQQRIVSMMHYTTTMKFGGAMVTTSGWVQKWILLCFQTLLLANLQNLKMTLLCFVCNAVSLVLLWSSDHIWEHTSSFQWLRLLDGEIPKVLSNLAQMMLTTWEKAKNSLWVHGIVEIGKRSLSPIRRFAVLKLECWTQLVLDKETVVGQCFWMDIRLESFRMGFGPKLIRSKIILMSTPEYQPTTVGSTTH